MFITNTTVITFDATEEQALIDLFLRLVDPSDWTKQENTTGGITFKRVQMNRIWKEEEC